MQEAYKNHFLTFFFFFWVLFPLWSIFLFLRTVFFLPFFFIFFWVFPTLYLVFLFLRTTFLYSFQAIRAFLSFSSSSFYFGLARSLKTSSASSSDRIFKFAPLFRLISKSLWYGIRYLSCQALWNLTCTSFD